MLETGTVGIGYGTGDWDCWDWYGGTVEIGCGIGDWDCWDWYGGIAEIECSIGDWDCWGWYGGTGYWGTGGHRTGRTQKVVVRAGMVVSAAIIPRRSIASARMLYFWTRLSMDDRHFWTQ